MSGKQEYLEETYYCDYIHPVIQDISKQFNTSKNIALDIFIHVRDKYALCSGETKAKASETAKNGYGTCWNKVLVILALLRSHSIPCRMIKHPLKRDFLKPLLGYDYIFLNNPYNHFFIQIYTNGKWIYTDTSLDSKAYEKLYKPLNVPWTIDWDGESDHIIHTNKSLGDFEVIEEIDKEIHNNASNRPTPSFMIPFSNRKYWKKTGWDEVFGK